MGRICVCKHTRRLICCFNKQQDLLYLRKLLTRVKINTSWCLPQQNQWSFNNLLRFIEFNVSDDEVRPLSFLPGILDKKNIYILVAKSQPLSPLYCGNSIFPVLEMLTEIWTKEEKKITWRIFEEDNIH